MSRTHQIPGPVHRLWTADHEAVLTVDSGDVVELSLTEALGGQFDHLATGDAMPDVDWDLVYPLAGPVAVAGAEPGDVVSIEFLAMESVGWGWSAVLPGLGLLPEDFPDPHFHRWDLTGAKDSGGIDYLGVATVPYRPFCGVVGVHPEVPEPLPPLPPGHFGGNVDIRDLRVGTTLHLPVQTSGAKIAFGDPHAAQGDGEVCVTAVEASMGSAAARITLVKGRTIAAPQFTVSGPLRPGVEDAGFHATTGIAPDLMRASKDAVRAMVEHLGHVYGLSPVDAYILCSVVVDLKISQVVDAPMWTVSAYLPLSAMR